MQKAERRCTKVIGEQGDLNAESRPLTSWMRIQALYPQAYSCVVTGRADVSLRGRDGMHVGRLGKQALSVHTTTSIYLQYPW
jgi:hypothetical protein